MAFYKIDNNKQAVPIVPPLTVTNDFPDYGNSTSIPVTNPFSFTATEKCYLQFGFAPFTSQTILVNGFRTITVSRGMIPLSPGDVVTSEDGNPNFINLVQIKGDN